ncbi:MAG: acyl-CoA dehydrogenase [Acidimicrobiia bacterium]
MEFAFSEEQLAFRDAVRDFLETECPPARVREQWEPGAPGVPRDLWLKLGGIGVLGMRGPETAGGAGADEVDTVLALEETGRAAFPGPVVEHAAVAVPMLAELGDPAGWLPAAVAGEIIITVAEGAGANACGGVCADVVLVGEADALFALEQGACLGAVPSVDRTRQLARVPSLPEQPLARGPAVARALVAARDRAALGAAAQLIGLGDRMLAMSVAYAKERRQFGAPIGSYQAVKHHLANALVALEFARPVVHRAAWSVANDVPERSVHVSMAKATASDAARFVAKVALQCHGAIGYTTEYDLHLFMKRTWALAAAWGDARWHRRRVAAAVLDGQGS